MDNQLSEVVVAKDPQASKKILIIIGIVIGVILLTVGGYYIFQNFNKLPSSITHLPSAKPQELAAGGEVVISKAGFTPEVILVKKGTSVTWINKDSLPHQVTTDPYPTNDGLPGFDSGEPLMTRDSYTFTFEKVGKFTYHDNLNPRSFQGTIIVEEI